MTRSIKKGIFVDERLLKKIEGKNPLQTPTIKTWSRACVISPEMLGFTFGVHNGKTHVDVLVTEDMVGHRLGEFSPTKKFTKHGGKMQKEMDVRSEALPDSYQRIVIEPEEQITPGLVEGERSVCENHGFVFLPFFPPF